MIGAWERSSERSLTNTQASDTSAALCVFRGLLFLKAAANGSFRLRLAELHLQCEATPRGEADRVEGE